MCGELVPSKARPELRRRPIHKRAALLQRPDIDPRSALDQAIGREVVGISVIVEQSKAASHRGEISCARLLFRQKLQRCCLEGSQSQILLSFRDMVAAMLPGDSPHDRDGLVPDWAPHSARQ